MPVSREQFDQSLFSDIRNAVEPFPWIVALWVDWEDSRHWEDTIVLVAVIQSPVFHLPQHELRKALAPIENKHRVIFDPLMYFPTNAPHVDETTNFIICRDDFQPNTGRSFRYAVDDPVNQRKIEYLASFGDIVETAPEVRKKIEDRLACMDKNVTGGAHLIVEEWMAIIDTYDDEMLAKLFRSKNRRTQELAVTHPLPVGYFRYDYGIPSDKLAQAVEIALGS